MRASRILAVMAFACALGACQSTAGKHDIATASKTTSQSEAASGSWLDPRKYDDVRVTAPMKPRFTETTVHLVTKLITKCIDAKGEAARDACFRERLLAGFDSEGIASQHCPVGSTLNEQYLCIVLGSYSYEFVRTIGDEKDPQIDWADPERTMKQALIEFVTQRLKACLGGYSASDPTDCITAAITKQLGLTESDIEPCKSLAADDDFNKCVGEAYGLNFMDAGIARM